MHKSQIKTHRDGIWISSPREVCVVTQLVDSLIEAGFQPVVQNTDNFGLPYIFQRGDFKANLRLIDSVFMTDAGIFKDSGHVTITDNHALWPVPGQVISVLPEFWSIWYFEPDYIDRVPVKAFNCFMNRCRGDRSQVFYELCKRNILHEGFVSYNCSRQELEDQYQAAEMQSNYRDQHQRALELIPYNTVQSWGSVEQCIIDSRVSLIMETYTSDTHIVFSEKVFRCLQMPRPWLLYCSPGSVALLKRYGFDVLDDYVDISYDDIVVHGDRLQAILDQLETFIPREFTAQQMMRFKQASQHNQKLLQQFQQDWPMKFQKVLSDIKSL
jgi:hypothetical protein